MSRLQTHLQTYYNELSQFIAEELDLAHEVVTDAISKFEGRVTDKAQSKKKDSSSTKSGSACGDELPAGIIGDDKGKLHKCELTFGARSPKSGELCNEKKAKYSIDGKWYCGNIGKNGPTGHLKSAYSQYLKKQPVETNSEIPSDIKQKVPPKKSTLADRKSDKKSTAKSLVKKLVPEDADKLVLTKVDGHHVYVHNGRRIVFDKKTETAIGVLKKSGKVSDLNEDDIEFLESHNRNYTTNNSKKTNTEILEEFRKQVEAAVDEESDTSGKDEIDLDKVVSDDESDEKPKKSSKKEKASKKEESSSDDSEDSESSSDHQPKKKSKEPVKKSTPKKKSPPKEESSSDDSVDSESSSKPKKKNTKKEPVTKKSASKKKAKSESSDDSSEISLSSSDSD